MTIEREELPEVSEHSENLDERTYVQIRDFRISEWTPERDGQGKSHEVHMVFDVDDEISLIMRLKSAHAIDRIIAVLTRHRNSVWPEVSRKM